MFKSCTTDELAMAAMPDGDAGEGGTPNVDVTFPQTGAAMRYMPPCIKLPVGGTLTFNGSFNNHPLSGNGETGSPLPMPGMPEMGSTPVQMYTFATAGTFEFHCADHPSIMYGTVVVGP
jgi:plastocyanin